MRSLRSDGRLVLQRCSSPQALARMQHIRLNPAHLQQTDRGVLIRMLVEYRRAVALLRVCELPHAEDIRGVLEQSVAEIERELLTRQEAGDEASVAQRPASPRLAPLYATPSTVRSQRPA